LPFLYLVGGYAVQQIWKGMREKALSLALAGAAAVILFGWPLVELQAWTPFYSFYLNSLGGGARNITRYFAPDEVAEFDTREVAQQVCPFAPVSTKVATARPMSMAYYLEACGRTDIQVVPLYDRHYAPRDGDLIILEPSRRFFETQHYFDALKSSGMSHSDVRVGPVFASTIYLFDPSLTGPSSGKEEFTLTQLRGAPPPFENDAQEAASRSTNRFGFSNLTGRLIQ
jgi:hypothetical protein